MKQLIYYRAPLLILCFITLYACSSDNSNDDTPQSINTEDCAYFISGKIDGKDFLYGLESQPTSIDYYSIHGVSGGCTNDNSSYSGLNYSSGVYADAAKGQSIGFEFIRFYLCSNPKSKVEVFNDSFPIKNYSLSESDSSISGTDGSIGISYSPNIDEDLYFTSYGGNSVNGSFKITKSTEKNEYLLNQLVNAYQEIEGTFSCTLYSIDNPAETIEITNGKFKLQVKLL